jgi:hydrogenase-4 component E
MTAQLLDLACGGFLLCAVLVLWRRELAVIVRVFAVQGALLAVMVALLAVEEGSAELAVVAVVVALLRAVLLPYLLGRALASAGPGRRETHPSVNVTASLLCAALLASLAYAVSRPLVALSDAPAAAAVPVGLTVVLIGFFVMVTRRRALSQVVGLLLMDNGITAVGFLAGAEMGLVVELGVSLDVLLAVLVLQTLTTRMREAYGDTDLDELRELHD